jgi:hypothetical protein
MIIAWIIIAILGTGVSLFGVIIIIQQEEIKYWKNLYSGLAARADSQYKKLVKIKSLSENYDV